MRQLPEHKLKPLLLSIKEKLASNDSIKLAMEFRCHHLSSEYAKIVIDQGIVIRMSDGSRGPSRYKFNNDIEITDELVSNLVLLHNKNTKEDKLRMIAQRAAIGETRKLTYKGISVRLPTNVSVKIFKQVVDIQKNTYDIVQPVVDLISRQLAKIPKQQSK